MQQPASTRISGPVAGRIDPEYASETISESQIQMIRAARAAQKPFRRAARVATASGVTLLLCAAGSLLLALFGFQHLIAAAVLGVVGTIELRGASLLRAARRGAGSLLMCNQIALAALLVLYGAIGLARTLASNPATLGFSEQTAAFLEQNPDMGLGGLGRIMWIAMLAMYGGVIAFGVLCQGSMAWYYAAKERRLRDWHAVTPRWAAQLLEQAA